ncbi:MAG: 3-oxoacyl-[acyl-carrier-protein] synthase 2 [Alphaproteobacteria bacterium MarineAlpha5_Bin12]|nr:MAG: 3-oxoacyl-[acyl-carrier-protein] synthase 2 [Alphaproteobacteria bacterium MarineAlpha5_Bin12]|tara:strand:+ start:27970 stop:29232 length:1263 start_codon:yes stop_codon:yes gene_type:complete
MRRVVVTGIGLVTSLGDGVKNSWDKLINSKSGIKSINHFDTQDLNCKIGAYINHSDDAKDNFDSLKYIDKKNLKKIDRFILYGMAAAIQAVEDSGINQLKDEQKYRTGVIVGSGIGGLETIYNTSLDLYNKGARRISPFFIPSALINLLSGQISIKFNFKGPNHAVVTACATGAHSIGDGSEIIKRGDADVMVTGGSEAAICRIGIAGFSAARSLSTNFNDEPQKASRPWDEDRDGFVMGEGSGILILEELEHAKKRKAKIYAEVIGYGMSGDAYHITAPSDTGEGGYLAMNNACKNAKIDVKQIDYINAHGTSTQLGDEVEVKAIKKLFNEDKPNIMVSSTKSAIGHLLGAAGSVESIISILSLNNNILPPTLNLDKPSINCDLDFIPHTSRDKKINIALSNSFGFGGTNTALLFKKFN